MSDLIYRCDVDLFSPMSGIDEMIHELMDEYGLTWQANIEDNNFDEDKIYEFARELMTKAQNYIDTAVAITTDDYFSFKCKNCGSLYIDNGANLFSSHCPVCGEINKLGYL